MANTMTTEVVAPPPQVVQMEGPALLRIIKHCKEFSPALVNGQLLGLDVGSVLEVTNCFPLPIREEDEEVEAEGANDQLKMMRCLREVNVDNNAVGCDFWDSGMEDYCMPTTYSLGSPHCPWDSVKQNDEESVLFMIGDQTPIKECGDFSLDPLDIGGESNKEIEEYRESSQCKRRRMLQFTSNADNTTSNDHQLTLAIDNSKGNEVEVDSSVVDSSQESLESNAQFYSDDAFLFSNEVLDQSIDGWLENYFTENDLSNVSTEMSSSTLENANLADQIHVPAGRTEVVPKPPRTSTLKIFKGAKSFINSRMKLTTSSAKSVAYPFTLIKPCADQVDMTTLKDINQRIYAPPPKSKHDRDGDPYAHYPTSAFSGKPVVAKTKIRTEGGKGSITILRTKG